MIPYSLLIIQSSSHQRSTPGPWFHGASVFEALLARRSSHVLFELGPDVWTRVYWCSIVCVWCECGVNSCQLGGSPLCLDRLAQTAAHNYSFLLVSRVNTLTPSSHRICTTHLHIAFAGSS